MTEDQAYAQAVRRWEDAGRPAQHCPHCGIPRRTPDTLRAHIAIAHPEQETL